MANSIEIERIIVQYCKTVGTLDSMFTVTRVRTNQEVWRDNGIGSCVINKTDSEEGLIGSAKKSLINLREEKNRQHGGISTVSLCPYHRENYGCVLGNLKSPYCIAHFDADWDWKERFNVDALSLKPEIELVLSAILNGQALEDPSGVERFNGKILLITDQIAQYPLFDESLRPGSRFNRFNIISAEGGS